MKHYHQIEHSGKRYAVCPICDGAFKLDRIVGPSKAAAMRCMVISRDGNPGGDINPTATRKVGAIKRMLASHLKSGVHIFVRACRRRTASASARARPS